MQTNLKLLGAIAILGATLAISGIALQDAMAANSANKSSFQSATMEVIMASNVMNEDGAEMLAWASMKASNPQDVLILYDEECSLYTELNLKGPKKGGSDGIETDEVRAAHLIDLTIDGVSVTSESITMCDRTYGMSTNILSQIEEICDVVSGSDIDPEGELVCDETFLDTWINTKAAHGWHWVVVNLGDWEDVNEDGVLTFEVIGSVEIEDEKNRDTTGVAIGQRSLTVVPIHLDVGA
jgi:hypothetical protein